MVTENTIHNAEKILPFLVQCAQMHSTIEYGELSTKAGLPHHRVLNNPLGYIRDHVCTSRGLPLLNVLVVKKDDQLSGSSFLEEGTDHLSEEEYKKRFEQERDEAFLYVKWDDLLSELGLKSLEPTDDALDNEGKAYNQVMGKHGSGGEGERHNALKCYVSQNPQLIRPDAEFKMIEMEHDFISADRCDILIEFDDHPNTIVEIKVGDLRGELIKGIYQLIQVATKGS